MYYSFRLDIPKRNIYGHYSRVCCAQFYTQLISPQRTCVARVCTEHNNHPFFIRQAALASSKLRAQGTNCRYLDFNSGFQSVVVVIVPRRICYVVWIVYCRFINIFFILVRTRRAKWPEKGEGVVTFLAFAAVVSWSRIEICSGDRRKISCCFVVVC